MSLELGLTRHPRPPPADDFRFCFFLRPNSNDRHVVLLKDRRYISRPLPGHPAAADELEAEQEDAAPSPPVTRMGEGRGRKRGRDESERVMSDEPEGMPSGQLHIFTSRLMTALVRPLQARLTSSRKTRAGRRSTRSWLQHPLARQSETSRAARAYLTMARRSQTRTTSQRLTSRPTRCCSASTPRSRRRRRPSRCSRCATRVGLPDSSLLSTQG